MDRRHFISSAAFAAMGTALLARAPAAWALSAKSAAGSADLDIAIIKAAIGIHPGLYRYQSPRVAMRELSGFEAQYRKATAHEDMRAAYLALSRYLATLRCGHSYANFFNQDDPDITSLFAQTTRLPFWFRWVGDRMIITHDTQGHGLVSGSAITHINGQTAGKLLAALLPYTRADGSNDGKRRALLSVQAQEKYETFDIFQGLIAPPRDGGLHHITLTTPDRRTFSRTLPAIDLAQRRAEMAKAPNNSDGPQWTWDERADGVHVLGMPSWGLWNSKWDWRRWLDERLDSLGSAKGLIIDIRENEGGDNCGNPILARLIDRPLPAWPFETRLRFNQMPPLLREHSSTWDERFYDLGEGAVSVGNGEWIPNEADLPSEIAPSSKRIACPVAALIGPTNSSATFAFVNAARATGKMRLFGETTGGNRRSINGGAFLFVKLPYSGIEFDLPLKGYVSPTPQPDAGIIPDVVMPFAPAWIGAASDPVLEAAASWCFAHHNRA